MTKLSLRERLTTLPNYGLRPGRRNITTADVLGVLGDVLVGAVLLAVLFANLWPVLRMLL